MRSTEDQINNNIGPGLSEPGGEKKPEGNACESEDQDCKTVRQEERESAGGGMGRPSKETRGRKRGREGGREGWLR